MPHKIYKIEIVIIEPLNDMSVDIEFDARKKDFINNKEKFLYESNQTT